MSKDKTLATFQIEKSKWSKFKRLTGNQSASAVLVQFIENFLDNPHILEQSNYSETSNIEYQSIMDSRIKALEDRLSILERSDIQTAGDLARKSIINLETRFKELENKLSVIEESNTESAINLAIQSISNLQDKYKELKDKLTIIERSNQHSVTNSDRESINNLESKYQELEQRLFSLEGDHPSAITENIDKEEEVGTYPEDAIKLLDEEAKTETEIPDKVRSLSTGTELTGKQLAELIGVDPSYLSKYKSGKITPPVWFWENFEAIGEGNKSRWLKK